MYAVNMFKIANIKGFTLIELLLVVGILGILSAALLATLDPFSQFQKGNDSRRKSDLSQIQKAIETYYQDKGKYPINNPATDYRIYDERTGQNKVIDWGLSWSPYMNILPKDSNSSRNYVYKASSDGQSYWIYASLDRGGKDPQACNAGNLCTNATGLSCGGTCNYGVTSTNTQP